MRVKKGNKQGALPSRLNDFFSGSWIPSAFSNLPKLKAWAPSVDVTEDAKAVHVTAELPGMAEKDVKVEINEGYLTISGEKKQETEKKTKSAYRLERSYGAFSRTLSTGNNILENKIKAEFRNGILHVTLPKGSTNKKKQIKIN